MEHFHFHKNKLLAVADVQGVTGFDDIEIPVVFAVLSFQTLDGIGGTVDGGIRDLCHQSGQGSGVVYFTVVDNDIVNVVEVNFFFQIFNEFKAMGCPNCVDQDGLFFLYQIGILTEPF